MTIDLDSCNRALGDVGARSTVADINEDSPEAKYCRLYYDKTLRQLLRAAHWSFARGFAASALLKALPGTPENPGSFTVWTPAYPPPNWLYTYAIPNDCEQVRYLLPNYNLNDQQSVPVFPGQMYAAPAYNQPIAFAIVNDTDLTGNSVKVICADQPAPLICYTRYIDTPGLWDDSFSQAFSAALASRLVMPLRGDPEVRKVMMQIANSIILEARVRDGNEGITEYAAMPDWIQIRGINPMNAYFPQRMDYGPLFS